MYIELKTGPGTKTPTGAVTPNGKAEVEVNVAFKTYEARRLGQTVLAYIQAWDILRLMAHRNLLGKMAAYELVPTTSRNGTNNQRAQSTQARATGTTSRGTPSLHRPAHGKQPLAGKPNAAASPPVAKPVPTNGAGVAQPVKRQASAPVAAAKTPPPQITNPVSREQHTALAKTQATKAAATTPTVKTAQVNRPGVNPPRQEKTTAPDAAAERLDSLLVENDGEERKAAVKGARESGNAAATPRAEPMAQLVNEGQLSEHETTLPAEVNTTTRTSIANGSDTPRPVQSASNGQFTPRPLTRRGPAPRPGLKRPLAGTVATPMPKQPSAAITSTATYGDQPPVTNDQGIPQPVSTAAAMAEAIYGSAEQPLRYLNGTLVDLTNQSEVQAFLRYRQEKQQAPPSRPRLRVHVQQHQTA